MADDLKPRSPHSRYWAVPTEEDGWSPWIEPRVVPGEDQTYKMMCCDCGLVHGMRFAVYPGPDGHTPAVRFKVVRDNRATGQARRRMAREGFGKQLVEAVLRVLRDPDG